MGLGADMKLFSDSGYTAFRLGLVGLALSVTEAPEIDDLSADVIRRLLEPLRRDGGQSMEHSEYHRVSNQGALLAGGLLAGFWRVCKGGSGKERTCPSCLDIVTDSHLLDSPMSPIWPGSTAAPRFRWHPGDHVMFHVLFAAFSQPGLRYHAA
ncbi:hypothetical protein V2G26_014639 [Clonostachys chloroleuca]